jgi:hypothetical protein
MLHSTRQAEGFGPLPDGGSPPAMRPGLVSVTCSCLPTSGQYCCVPLNPWINPPNKGDDMKNSSQAKGKARPARRCRCGDCDYCAQGESLGEERRRLAYEDWLISKDEPVREW